MAAAAPGSTRAAAQHGPDPHGGEEDRQKPRKQNGRPAGNEREHPVMRAGAGGQIALPVRRPEDGLGQGPVRSRSRHLREGHIRQEERQHQQDRGRGRETDDAPVARGAPAVPGDGEYDRGPPDHQPGEDAVVAAEERRDGEGEPQDHSPARSRPIGEPVEREHRDREAGRRQQLDLGRVRHRVRTERETDGGDGGGSAAAGQPPYQGVHRDGREHEQEEEGRVVRHVRAVGQPVAGHGQHARSEVALRVGQGAAVRVVDVRVVQMRWIDHEGPCHPGHVPDTEAPVPRVGPSERRRMEADRVEQHGGQGDRVHGHQRALEHGAPPV